MKSRTSLARDAVAGQLILIEADLQCWLSRDLLTGHVGCSLDGQENLLELIAQTPQLRSKSSPMILIPTSDRIPGDHFVDAHLDGLGETPC